MSAIRGIVPVPPPDETAAGGSLVQMRPGSPSVEPVQPSASTLSDLGPVSPELALVDPELARAAREQLPDPPRPVPVRVAAVAEQPVLVEPPARSLEPVPEPAAPRRRLRLGLLASAAGVAALGVMLTLVVGREQLPTRNAQETKSVASAVSPPEATPTQAVGAAPSTPAEGSAIQGKTFVWVSSQDAAAYEFQLFRGGERVFRARVAEARLELPGRWRQAGTPGALLPGRYRWYVWAISRRTNRQSTKPTVSAELVIDEQPR